MPIRIDLLRHGIAESFNESGDAARVLTPEGQAAIRVLGTGLGRVNWQPDRAYSSPFRRARQTMALVIETAGLKLAPKFMAELQHESTPADTERALRAELGAALHVLLVSHQPLVGLLTRYWTGKLVPFAPGDLVGIEFSSAIAPGMGQIVEHISSLQ